MAIAPLILSTGRCVLALCLVSALTSVEPADHALQAAERIAAPRFWDMYWGKKDRLHLDGLWKLKRTLNLLDEAGFAQRLEAGRTGKGQGLVFKAGQQVRYEDCLDDPGLVAGLQADVVDTAGWEDTLVPLAWGSPLPWEDASTRRPGLVPWLKRNQVVGHHFGGVAWYRRGFQVPPGREGARAFLTFLNVDVAARVWINGRQLSAKDHRNLTDDAGYRVYGAWLNGFTCEVSAGALRAGVNTVAVRVWAPGAPCYWGSPNPGGITAPVWLEFRPPVFADRILIRPRPLERAISLRFRLDGAQVAEGTVEVGPWTSEDYRFPGRAGSWREPFSTADGQVALSMALPGAETWSPALPCLYAATIRDREGRVLGVERFGLAELAAAGDRLLLNGRDTLLFGLNAHHAMFEFCGGGNPAEVAEMPVLMNHGDRGREVLRARRRAGFTMMRVHTGPAAPWAYSLCDEEGLIVSDEWSMLASRALDESTGREVEYEFAGGYAGFFDASGDLRQVHQEALRRWVEGNARFAGVLLLNAGNEMSGADPQFQRFQTWFHRLVHRFDPRGRLVAPGSGPHLDGAGIDGKAHPVGAGEGPVRLPADYFDVHDYNPFTRYSLLQTRASFLDFAERVRGIYGRPVPMINGETFLGMRTPLARHDQPLPPGLDPSQGALPSRLLEFLVRRPEGFDAGVHEGKQLDACAYGLPALFDCEATRTARRDWLRAWIEQVRYAVPEMRGYALHMPSTDWMRQEVEGGRGEAFGGPDLAMLARAQAPLQAMVRGLHAVSVFAGERSVQDLVVVNNGEAPSGALRLVASIAGAEAASQEVASLDPGVVAPYRLVLQVPALAPGGHRLVLELRSRDAVRAVNVYDCFVTRRTGLGLAMQVLDCPDDQARAAVLSLGGTPFDFDPACQDLLLVGPGAFVPHLVKPWVEAGGRALILAQPVGTLEPWLDTRVIASERPVPVSSPVAPDGHALLAGLSPRQFGWWNGGATAFDCFLPRVVDGTSLVLGYDGMVRKHGSFVPTFGSVVHGAAAGRGRYLWTQLKLHRHLADAAAWHLMRNCVSTLRAGGAP
jgi:hypothetical protein